MKPTNNQLTVLDKYTALQNYGINPKFIANELNKRELKRKTNSPYVPQTVVYTANGYQNDVNIINIIDEMHVEYCSKSPLQNA
jgi:hypothetical protein